MLFNVFFYKYWSIYHRICRCEGKRGGVRGPTHLCLLLSFMGGSSESEEYDDSDSESEDPFTSHQARRQASSGSQRGATAPFYNYPGAGWTPPFSSAPPLPWVTKTLRHTDRQTERQTDRASPSDERAGSFSEVFLPTDHFTLSSLPTTTTTTLLLKREYTTQTDWALSTHSLFGEGIQIEISFSDDDAHPL